MAKHVKREFYMREDESKEYKDLGDSEKSEKKESVKKWTSFYRDNGFSVIPIETSGKKPLVRDWNNPYKTFGIPDGANIGIVLGNGWMGIDIDSPSELIPKILFGKSLSELTKKWHVSRTPSGGCHIYFPIPQGIADKPIFVNDKDGKRVIEGYSHDRFFVEEPSIIDDKKWEWLEPFKKAEGLKHDHGWYADLKNHLLFWQKYLGVVETIAPKWKEGVRHSGAMVLAGTLRKADVSKEDTIAIIQRICDVVEDNEVDDRLRAIDDTWSKGFKDIQGISGIGEAFGEEAERYIRKLLKRGKKSTQKEWLEWVKYFVEKVEKESPIVTTRDTSEMYRYSEGVYLPHADVFIKELVEREMGIADKISVRGVKAEVIDHIKDRHRIDREEINADRSTIPLENGLLNLETLKIEAFDPKRIYTYRLSVRFDPSAECPKIEKFMSEVFAGVEDEIPLIEEMFGYCLYPQMPKHISFWLYGSGSNGKSQLATILKSFVGAESTASVDFHRFEYERFASADLFGKLLNLVGEPSTQELKRTNTFKALTGDDSIRAERKNRDAFNFVNFSKLVVYANRFPVIMDDTFAFWRRICVIRFPNRFVGDNEKKLLGQKLASDKKEMSGLLNLAIGGLRRLKKSNWEFSISKSGEETKLEFKKMSDPIGAFLDQCTVFDRKAKTSSADLYDGYKKYCGKIGADIESANKFGRRVREMPYVRKDQWRGRRSRVVTGYRNIRLAKTENYNNYLIRENSESVSDVSDVSDFSTRVFEKNKYRGEKEKEKNRKKGGRKFTYIAYKFPKYRSRTPTFYIYS